VTAGELGGGNGGDTSYSVAPDPDRGWAVYGLPPGLTASAAGVLSGKPQLAGSYVVIAMVSRGGGWGYALFRFKIT
jgi:hypothetical protein